MARLAVIADIHSDLVSLEQAYGRVEELDVDLVLCAGDAIDHDLPDGTEEVIAILKERGAICIRGNHERWVLQDEERLSMLSPASREWLKALQKSWRSEIEGIRVSMFHARPGSDMEGIYEDQLEDIGKMLREADSEVVIVGHTHEPLVREGPGGGLIVNPGTLMLRQSAAHSAYLINPDSASTKLSAPEGGSFAVIDLPEMKVELGL